MKFTNNSARSVAFDTVASILAFQDGVSLDYEAPPAGEDDDANNYLKLAPRKTLRVQSTYRLRSASPVEVEVREYGGNSYQVVGGAYFVP